MSTMSGIRLIRLIAPADRPAGAKGLVELGPKGPSALDVEGLVDGLVRHAPLRVHGVFPSQPVGDLAGREALLQESLHLAGQPRAGHELGRFRTLSTLPSSLVGLEGPVVGPATVVGDLARDRRGRPTEAHGDLA